MPQPGSYASSFRYQAPNDSRAIAKHDNFKLAFDQNSGTIRALITLRVRSTAAGRKRRKTKRFNQFRAGKPQPIRESMSITAQPPGVAAGTRPVTMCPRCKGPTIFPADNCVGGELPHSKACEKGFAGRQLAILPQKLDESDRGGTKSVKRTTTIMAMTAAGALLASSSAHAAEMSMAERILNAVYADLGISSENAESPQSKNGFFVGVHSGFGGNSGLIPATAGLSIPLNSELEAESIAANGYYVFTTDWSLGTYVGGGFGKFNLGEDPLLNSALPRGNFGYQGMAGLTYSFTPSMVLGLEYRYSEPVNNPYFTQNTLPRNEEEDQSVTLRFDFLLN